MVETGGLENRLRRKVHGGSNPSSSARLSYFVVTFLRAAMRKWHWEF